SFAGYDLIVLTEDAPGISSGAMSALSSAGKPILLVEGGSFNYAYQLGLVSNSTSTSVSTQSVEFAEDGTYDLSWYLGQEPQVYKAPRAISGTTSENVSSGMTPLMYSFKEGGQIAALKDSARNIIATGVYDTAGYNGNAWQLFDLLLQDLRPIGPVWGSQEQMVQGYAQSGLMSYIENLTGSEPANLVLSKVWSTIFRWNLHPLSGHVANDLIQINSSYIMFPSLNPDVEPPQPHPLWNENDSDSPRWFLGQYKDQGVPAHGNSIIGADLGISTGLYSDTFFYMGDTWAPSASSLDPSAEKMAILLGLMDIPPLQPSFHSYPVCQAPAQCNDSIVRIAKGERDPRNGINTEVVTRGNNAFLPQIITGVHNQFGSDMWNVDGAVPVVEISQFSVPTGATTGERQFSVFWPLTVGQPPAPRLLSIQEVQLWYTTHCMDKDKGKSWVGCSPDGSSFGNCYQYKVGETTHFASFSQQKFIQVSPVEVTRAQLDEMGDDAPPHPSDSTGGYFLYGVGKPYRCSPVYLAYVDYADFGLVVNDKPKDVKYYDREATPRPWTDLERDATPIIGQTEYCKQGTEELARIFPDQYIPHRQALLCTCLRTAQQQNLHCSSGGKEWWNDQVDPFSGNGGYHISSCGNQGACPILPGGAVNCDAAVGSGCEDDLMCRKIADYYYDKKVAWPILSHREEAFGEFSVKVVYQDKMVMFSSHPYEGEVVYRLATLTQPWHWMEIQSVSPPTYGYGPYIIAPLTQVVGVVSPYLRVWYVISTWKGSDQYYGMFTTHADFTLSYFQ
ncbi:MAG: hypothetical protein PHU25_18545, partial [Deltaproteobacteria bacterium]|nr:hypothetical protein [Deltaproteobacteria bacterium]